MNRVRIGAGAGYSGDRIEPAVELAQKGAAAMMRVGFASERPL